MDTLVAYVAALAGAITFALSAVLQQASAREVPEEESLSTGMVADLLRRRVWLAGVGAMVLAYLFQAAALGFGPVALVEPIIVTELIFAVPIAVRQAGKRPGVREWAGMILAAAGVGAFLIAASPSGGTPTPTPLHWLYGFLPWAGISAVLLVVARGPESPKRAGLLAAAAGISFGLLSLVTKSGVSVLTHGGLLGLLESWQPWVLIPLGIGGFLVSQSAYQAAPLASSLPIMDTVEPISAVLFGYYVLGERISLSPVDIAVELTGAIATVVGIFLLGRSPMVLAIYESTERSKREEANGDRGGRQPETVNEERSVAPAPHGRTGTS